MESYEDLPPGHLPRSIDEPGVRHFGLALILSARDLIGTGGAAVTPERSGLHDPRRTAPRAAKTVSTRYVQDMHAKPTRYDARFRAPMTRLFNPTRP